MLSNFTQKAYEICYAVFRLGTGIKNPDLRTRLEKAGLDLLEAGSLNDNTSLTHAISVLEVLVNFSQGIGEISYPQSQVLLREIGNFNITIKKSNSAIAELNLEEFFQSNLQENIKSTENMPMMVNKADEFSINNEKSAYSHNIIETKEETSVLDKDKENAAMGSPFERSGEARQSAIIDIMRQVKNCRIKDLIAAFPGVSERTLRYDLQKLCEEGMIERIGSGGPGTNYQLKNVTSN